MKNQYFGDILDLFKYDLITEVIKGTPSLKKFTFIPMLTPNDNRNDGNERNYNKAKAGYDNRELSEFLEPMHAIDKDQRDFTKIRNYFKKLDILTEVYSYNKEDFFTHKTRGSYFKNIGPDLLKSALIFIDPDNGLEIKNSNYRHILYSELKEIFERSNRIVTVIQFFPRENHDYYIKRRLSELSRITNNLRYIADSRVVFFFLCKSLVLSGFLKEEILLKYTEKYPKLIFG